VSGDRQGTDPYGRRVGILSPDLPDLDLAARQRGSRRVPMLPMLPLVPVTATVPAPA